ncbi:D-alanyl-D-alanine carboxypeptidase [Lachnospiraceae bacterium NE2001]|nr:D-alanyl-D-alanine carboxypeptidase [Lachnospiraceae bacterium NE2001]
MKKYLISVLIILIILNSFIPCNISEASSWTLNKSAVEIGGNATSTSAELAPSDAPIINAASAIVMDVDTGDILYEKYAHEKHYPASITKVLTCLLAVENGNVNDVLTVSENVMSQVEMDSSRIGLEAGEQLTLRDALYGMMLNSGNECALTIGEYIAGSTEGFADMMNERIKTLGCTDSHFVNPNGIHNDDHYTSCYDMALIGCAAYQYPEFKKLISSQTYTIPETNKNEERVLWQENRLIYSGNGEYYYQYCTGGKTGYTETALATLISFAERDGRRLVTVVMKCNPTTESYLDTIKLDEFCFNKYKLCKPLVDFELPNVNNTSSSLLGNYYADLDHELPEYYVNSSYSFYIRSHVSDDEVEKQIEFYDKPIGNLAGKIRFYYNGFELGASDITVKVPFILATSTDAIVAEKSIPAPEPVVKKYIMRVIYILAGLIAIALIILLYIKIRNAFRRFYTKRTIKYYPVSRDMRSKKNREAAKKALEAEQAAKKEKEQET